MTQSVGFGEYRFQLDTGQLWFRGQEVRLTPKAAGVLKILVSNAGSPVSKSRLVCVRVAGRRGDRRCPHDVHPGAAPRPQRRCEAPAVHRDSPPEGISIHRRGVSGRRRRRRRAAARTKPAISSIAVLPFADMSPSHDQEYLCEGLAEELINALTQVDGLRVAARTASFQFRGKGEDIQTVGAQLNVEALLEGSVRKSDDRLRVTVQLIEVASGYHRWSHRFDGQFKDVFAIQDEIAESVATSLCCGAVSPPTKRTPLRAHDRDRRPTSCTCADASTFRGSGTPI